MSFISRDSVVFRRIITRLNLKLDEREVVTIPSSIQPILSVDAYFNDLQNISVNSGPGAQASHVSDYIVPKGKRWTIIGAFISRAATDGTNDIWILDPKGVPISLTKGTAGKFLSWIGKDIVIDQNWVVQLVSSAGTPGAINHFLMYREEDAF